MILTALAAAFLVQGSATYETPNGVLKLTNFNTTSGNLVDDTVTVTGSSEKFVRVEDTASGLTLQAKTLTVELKRLESGAYALINAKASGACDVAYESSRAFNALVERSKKLAQVAPELPPTQTSWHLSCDQFEFTRVDKQGTLTMAGQVDAVYDLKSQQQSQSLSITATSGVLSLQLVDEPSSFGLNNCRMNGPVQIVFNQEGGIEDDRWNVKGYADVLTLDFLAAEGIAVELSGGVTADVKNTSFPKEGDTLPPGFNTNTAKIMGDTATVILDRESRRPVRYKFSGKPAETRIKPGGKP